MTRSPQSAVGFDTLSAKAVRDPLAEISLVFACGAGDESIP